MLIWDSEHFNGFACISTQRLCILIDNEQQKLFEMQIWCRNTASFNAYRLSGSLLSLSFSHDGAAVQIIQEIILKLLECQTYNHCHLPPMITLHSLTLTFAVDSWIRSDPLLGNTPLFLTLSSSSFVRKNRYFLSSILTHSKVVHFNAN